MGDSITAKNSNMVMTTFRSESDIRADERRRVIEELAREAEDSAERGTVGEMRFWGRTANWLRSHMGEG